MPIKILTVDDSRTIRLIVGRAFKGFDCEVLEAANGMEGLATAARKNPTSSSSTSPCRSWMAPRC